MSLISELDGACLVVADEDLGLLFCWYGEWGVQILNEQGTVVDNFFIEKSSGNVTIREARSAIARYRAQMFGEDDS